MVRIHARQVTPETVRVSATLQKLVLSVGSPKPKVCLLVRGFTDRDTFLERRFPHHRNEEVFSLEDLRKTLPKDPSSYSFNKPTITAEKNGLRKPVDTGPPVPRYTSKQAQAALRLHRLARDGGNIENWEPEEVAYATGAPEWVPAPAPVAAPARKPPPVRKPMRKRTSGPVPEPGSGPAPVVNPFGGLTAHEALLKEYGGEYKSTGAWKRWVREQRQTLRKLKEVSV